ncbi:MAG: hypothetical protein EZS28_025167 [Streblomastix strix]|uniref:Uncharacterized protein n=1 Tax=Streblomastix strix TaxID=222440 RepID=A0A5J4V9W2_9EUKA|nr:MAG: hypothetical protein EZS28_025167 [Streblomastix strix]
MEALYSITVNLNIPNLKNRIYNRSDTLQAVFVIEPLIEVSFIRIDEEFRTNGEVNGLKSRFVVQNFGSLSYLERSID